MQTQWTLQTPCGSQEDQRFNHRRPHQQKPPGQHTIECSITNDRDKTFPQMRLLPCLPLSANGRLSIHTNSRLQLCKPNVSLLSRCSKFKQITLSSFKLHERLRRQSNQSQPICTICGRHWHCSERYKTSICNNQDCF